MVHASILAEVLLQMICTAVIFVQLFQTYAYVYIISPNIWVFICSAQAKTNANLHILHYHWCLLIEAYLPKSVASSTSEKLLQVANYYVHR